MMRSLSFAVLMTALPGIALAATPPAKPTTAAVAAKSPSVPAVAGARGALSPEGRAIAAKIVGVPDPRAGQIQAEMVTIRQQKAQIIGGTAIDVDRLEPLLRREEALQSEFRMRQNDRLLALLRALTDPDRVALLQSLANPARLQNAKPLEPGR